MKKRYLILPFLVSFFITSNVDSSVIYLYENKSINNNLLIAGDCGGGGGSTPVEKKAKKERKQKVKDEAKKE